MIKLYKNYVVARRNHEYMTKSKELNLQKNLIKKSVSIHEENSFALKRQTYLNQVNQSKNYEFENSKHNSNTNLLFLNKGHIDSNKNIINSPKHRRNMPSNEKLISEPGESVTNHLLLQTNNYVNRNENLNLNRGSLVKILQYGNVKKNGENLKKFEESHKHEEEPSKKDEILMSDHSEDIDYKLLHSELKISKVLNYSFTKKVIIVLMLMLIMVPFFDVEFWDNTSGYNYNSLLNYLNTFTNNGNISSYKNMSEILISLTEKYSDPNFPILNVTIHNTTFYINTSFDKPLREFDVGVFSTPDNTITIFFSNDFITFLTALIGIISTVVFAVILTITVIILERDSKILLLDPIEIMIEIVENVAKDPMKAKNEKQIKKGLKASFIEKNTRKKMKNLKKGNFEIKIIETALIRISALLVVGFGEAGKQIIKENLNKKNELHPMTKGRKIKAIFGFCNIRDFARVNIALEQDIMIFSNEIAEIVHSSVDKFSGSTNKNIGEAFLSVWKVNKKRESFEKKITGTKGKFPPVTNYLDDLTVIADNAIFGFLDIIKKINSYSYILDYSKHPKIVEKLGNFKVDMGFGLHFGWAIEGSIGSIYKIDASYLSPNVNIASRLQSATKHYGVNILISGETYDLFSDPVKKMCRLIDKVTVKGSLNPLRLYTVDVNLHFKPKVKEYNKMSLSKRKNIYESKKEKLLVNSYSGMANYFLNKACFKHILRNTMTDSQEFLSYFEEGIQFYTEGNWNMALKRFKMCLEIEKNDGPTKFLLNYMKQYNYLSPEDWPGYRQFAIK
jgi:class 3 adenylate cyclase